MQKLFGWTASLRVERHRLDIQRLACNSIQRVNRLLRRQPSSGRTVRQLFVFFTGVQLLLSQRTSLIDLRIENQTSRMLQIVSTEHKFSFEQIQQFWIEGFGSIPIVYRIDHRPTHIAMPKAIHDNARKATISGRGNNRCKSLTGILTIAK